MAWICCAGRPPCAVPAASRRRSSERYAACPIARRCARCPDGFPANSPQRPGCAPGSPVCLRSARCAGRSRTGCLRDRADGPPGPNRKCWRSVPAHARPASPQAPVRRGRCAAHSCRKAPYSAALAESAASAIEGEQPIQRLARLAAFGGRQGIDRLAQRPGHARRLEHRPELGGERRDLVVLHGDGAAGVMLAPPGQLRQSLVAPGRTRSWTAACHSRAARCAGWRCLASPGAGPGRRDAASGRHSHPSRSDRPSPATAPAPAPRDGWGSARSPASQCPAGRRRPD